MPEKSEAGQEIIALTSENFEAMLASRRALVVDFWASWCMPCRMLAPIVEQLAKKLAGEVAFGKVNVDEQPELAARFSVMSIPTCVIFKNGAQVGTTVGVMAAPALEKQILAALEK